MYELGGIFMDYYENRKVMAEAQHIYKKKSNGRKIGRRRGT